MNKLIIQSDFTVEKLKAQIRNQVLDYIGFIDFHSIKDCLTFLDNLAGNISNDPNYITSPPSDFKEKLFFLYDNSFDVDLYREWGSLPLSDLMKELAADNSFLDFEDIVNKQVEFKLDIFFVQYVGELVEKLKIAVQRSYTIQYNDVFFNNYDNEYITFNKSKKSDIDPITSIHKEFIGVGSFANITDGLDFVKYDLHKGVFQNYIFLDLNFIDLDIKFYL